MSSLPMVFPPAPFDLDEALRCAALVETAYDMYGQWVAQGKPGPQQFAWQPKSQRPLSFGTPIFGEDSAFLFMREPEPFAFVAWSAAGEVDVVIRGTESVEDWIADASASLTDYALVPCYGKVHDGFYRIYTSMRLALLAEVAAACAAVGQAAAVMVSGHSLGAALTTLAVPDLLAHTPVDAGAMRIGHYNLASPRTGDPDFAAAYNANRVITYRVVNTCDVVPELPSAVLGDLCFEHVGTPVDYTAHYRSIAGNHSITDAYGYALLHPGQPQGPLGQPA